MRMQVFKSNPGLSDLRVTIVEEGLIGFVQEMRLLPEKLIPILYSYVSGKINVRDQLGKQH